MDLDLQGEEQKPFESGRQEHGGGQLASLAVIGTDHWPDLLADVAKGDKADPPLSAERRRLRPAEIADHPVTVKIRQRSRRVEARMMQGLQPQMRRGGDITENPLQNLPVHRIAGVFEKGDGADLSLALSFFCCHR